ncbi:non-ribosomal peptide synthase domain TIGR01720/amino acid adenylation domain-containing protein [Chryseolinea serpens]|uniref:Non-ribosomal peptide synthase domain TIGR01720/amino acid adenylation domain-containing protein n=1 Tax=Chryseolinea serpens TaxID=947013 RepID=A0A1M5XU93_9BACT|nr:non-ribosomal peptide synthetase [Chryseolinea serpens]SHI03395.1 non-ribosomal peptide synthase domain TIGR01720/amino acid adenylation domain-containing protein [Chryseolinea serpens]
MNFQHPATLVDIIRQSSELMPDNGMVFIEGSGTETFVSYRELYAKALSALYQLQTQGLRRGDEVILQLDSNRDFVVVFWACVLGGLIPVPLSVLQTEENFTKLCNIWQLLAHPSIVTTNQNCGRIPLYGARLAADEEMVKAMVNCVIVDDIVLHSGGEGEVFCPSPTDIAYVQFSSGSTGDPKGVMLTHDNLISNIQSIHGGIQSPPAGDKFFSWMPLVHDMGLIGFHLTPLYRGWTHYLMPTELFIKHPSLWLTKVSDHRITFTSSPNFGYHYVLEHFDRLHRSSLDLSCLRVIVNGAEPISSELCESFSSALAPFGLKREVIFPVYGLAEASLAVTFSKVEQAFNFVTVDRNQVKVGDPLMKTERNGVSFVNVGQPVRDVAVRLVDQHGKMVGSDTIGKIEIKGRSVTQGYYKNAEATRRIMRPDGWLDTGDLGFFVDGNLYVTGRHKDIFFINGRNYYPHDIEKVAQEGAKLKLNAVVVVGYHNEGLQRDEVLAFVSFRRSPEEFVPVVSRLKEHVARATGVVIDHVLPVGRIPKTTSGKIQRFKLLERYQQGEFDALQQNLASMVGVNQSSLDAEMLDDVSRSIFRAWQSVLNTPVASVDENFFSVGGTSLKAGKLAALLAQQFQQDVPVEIIFLHPTLRKQAEYMSSCAALRIPEIEPSSSSREYYPLSAAQKGMFFHSRAQQSKAYNLSRVVTLRGTPDEALLEASLQLLVKRYEILRTTFYLVDDEPVQKIQPAPTGKLLKHVVLDRAVTDEDLLQHTKIFDLEESFPWNFTLFKTETEDCVLLLDIHHILVDGLSLTALVNQWWDLYQNKTDQQTAPLQFKEYCCWEQRMMQTDLWQSQRTFWMEQLAGARPAITWPADFNRPARPAYTGRKVRFSVSESRYHALKQLAVRNQVTLHMLMFALYQLLLHRFTGNRRIFTGVAVGGRRTPQLESVPGMFVNTLPIESTYPSQQSFPEFLADIKNKLIDAYRHADYPAEALLKEFNGAGGAPRATLFDTMFLYQDFGEVTSPDDFICEERFFDPGVARFDITLEVVAARDQMQFSLEYADQLFEGRSIQSLGHYYQMLLENVVRHPTSLLADLLLYSTEEKERLLAAGRGRSLVADAVLQETVHRQFEQRVHLNSADSAVKTAARAYSFLEINEKANRLAHTLIKNGVKPDVPVGIVCDLSENLVVAILAVLKAGGAYVPMDSDYPVARKKYIIQDSGMHVLLVSASQAHDEKIFGEAGAEKIIYIDRDEDYDANTVNPEVWSSPENLAYVIYTSGTTGQPKGVAVTHGNLMAYLRWASPLYAGETFALFTSIAFDLTVTSVFVPLVAGYCIRIYPAVSFDRVTVIQQIVEDDDCAVVKLTPSHLKIINELDSSSLSRVRRLKKIIVGGEQLDAPLCRAISDKFQGKVTIFNEYGPTETTVGCVVHAFDPVGDVGDVVPIGVPLGGNHVYVLDDRLAPVPAGVVGELYIAGDQVARGYLSKQELSHQRFVPNPFLDHERMYKTGDLVKLQHDMTILYIGRIDDMMKINGYRVEPGEIESEIKRFENIRDAVVVSGDASKQPKLCAYYTSPAPVNEEDLRFALRRALPFYMVPTAFRWLARIPLTVNGKIDKLALPAFDAGDTAVAAPRNETEETMVRIFKEVLRLDTVGIDDNFFELTGDSIKAVQIVSRLQRNGYALAVKDLLTAQTIRRVSAMATPTSGVRNNDLVTDTKLLTPIERWFFRKVQPDLNYYCQSVLLEFSERPDRAILEQTFSILLQHHDGLRLNYSATDHRFHFDTSCLRSPFVVEEHNVEGHRLSHRAYEAIGMHLKRSLDITSGSLMRCALIHDVLFDAVLIVVHHLATDGISWRILLEDFSQVYEALRQGNKISLPAKTASVVDYAHTLSMLQTQAYFEHEIPYWNEIERTRFRLPDDFTFQTFQAPGSGEISADFDGATTRFLSREAVQFFRTDVQVLLLTPLVLILREWTGKQDIVVELEGHGRDIEGLNTSRTVGWFTTLFPVVLSVEEGSISRQILKIKEQLRAVPHGGLGYGILKSYSESPLQDSLHPPQIRFNYLGEFEDEINNSLFTLSSRPSGADSAPENESTIHVEINAMIVSGSLRINLRYDRQFHKEQTMRWFLENYRKHLATLVDHLQKENSYHFSESDFGAVALDTNDLAVLFKT